VLNIMVLLTVWVIKPDGLPSILLWGQKYSHREFCIGLTPRELSALLVAILFNLVFAYLFEHSLIAVDVNQSLIENLGGYFWLRTFSFETIALVLHAKGRTSVLVF
jgi:hypothetical protein